MERYQAKNTVVLNVVVWSGVNESELSELVTLRGSHGYSLAVRGDTAVVADGCGSFWYVRSGEALAFTDDGKLSVLSHRELCEGYEVIL